MEDTLLVGDHLLVDKLAFAPPGPISKYLLPYEEPKRGDIIVFRYPVDIKQTFVKRVVGVPGDHIKMVEQAGVPATAISWTSRTSITRPTTSILPRQFPRSSPTRRVERAENMLTNNVVNGEVVVPPAIVLRHGGQPRQLARQPLLGLCAAGEYHRQAADHLLVVRGADGRAGEPDDRCRPYHRSGAELLHEDALEPHVPVDPRLPVGA